MSGGSRRGRQRPQRRGRPEADAPGEPVEVTIENIGDHGDGIAQGPTGRLYVPYTVPGDQALVSPENGRSAEQPADLIEILIPGADRAQPLCDHFGDCGGCALQHLKEDAYRRWKIERIARALDRVRVRDYTMTTPVWTRPATRRRAHFAALRLASGAVALGFRTRRGHRIVDLEVCPVLDPAIVALLPALRLLMADLAHSPGRASIMVSRLEAGLDVVITGPDKLTLEARERLARFAKDNNLARASWRPNEEADAEPIVQRRPVAAKFADILVPIPPGTFLQPSDDGENALIATVSKALAGINVVADLFSGVGTFSLPLAQEGCRVHALDSDTAALAALASAARSMTGSHGGAITTERRDLAMRPLLPEELRRFRGAVFDPPRAGARSQADALARSTVPVVVAVSCNPDTFARDARTLIDGGYGLEVITPVDQFLWSAEIELVAIFRRDRGTSRSP